MTLSRGFDVAAANVPLRCNCLLRCRRQGVKKYPDGFFFALHRGLMSRRSDKPPYSSVPIRTKRRQHNARKPQRAYRYHALRPAQAKAQFSRSGTFAAAASTTPASHRRYTDAMPCLQAVGWNLPCGICKGSVCRRGGVPPLHSYCALAGLYDHSSFTLPVS